MSPSRPKRHFAQAWNYRYSPSYGSPELSTRHPGQPGHDALAIRSAHVLADGRTLFLEIPELQPVNQLHLHVRPGAGEPDRPVRDGPRAGGTLHRVSRLPPGRQDDRRPPDPGRHGCLESPADAEPLARQAPGARAVTIEAGKNLSYSVRSFKVRAGEPIRLTFINPDAVPHNWALIKPGHAGARRRPGQQDHRRARRGQPPLHSPHRRRARLHRHRRAARPVHDLFPRPNEPGRYPYLCTFPGHWMVMNGEMIVDGGLKKLQSTVAWACHCRAVEGTVLQDRR